MNRQGYEIARLANAFQDEFEYVFAKIDPTSKTGNFWSWVEVLPTSATGPLTFTVLPGGRSGTIAHEPAMLFTGTEIFPTVTQPYAVLLKTKFFQKNTDATVVKKAWIWICNLIQGA